MRDLNYLLGEVDPDADARLFLKRGFEFGGVADTYHPLRRACLLAKEAAASGEYSLVEVAVEPLGFLTFEVGLQMKLGRGSPPSRASVRR